MCHCERTDIRSSGKKNSPTPASVGPEELPLGYTAEGRPIPARWKNMDEYMEYVENIHGTSC